MELLVDSHHGIYQAQIFAESFDILIINLEEIKDEIKDLLECPDNEHYWESFETVLDKAKLRWNNKVYTLHQDEDLWAVEVTE